MYRLVIQPNALEELEAAYEWLRKRAPDAAVKWFNGFVDALQQLKTAPESFGLVPDIRDVPYPIRQLLYGKRQHKYRAFFTIVGDEIHVLHIRHGARRTWRPKSFPDFDRPRNP